MDFNKDDSMFCVGCDKPVTKDDFCYGCEEYICEECSVNDSLWGKHDYDQHFTLSEEEES